MQPCPWCVLQRLIFVLIALVALLGLAWRGAGRHAAHGAADRGAEPGRRRRGAVAALRRRRVQQSCKLTLAERIISGLGLDGSLPEVFQPRASCADAAVKLLGVPYEFWSLTLFMLLGVMALRLLLQRASA